MSPWFIVAACLFTLLGCALMCWTIESRTGRLTDKATKAVELSSRLAAHAVKRSEGRADAQAARVDGRVRAFEVEIEDAVGAIAAQLAHAGMAVATPSSPMTFDDGPITERSPAPKSGKVFQFPQRSER